MNALAPKRASRKPSICAGEIPTAPGFGAIEGHVGLLDHLIRVGGTGRSNGDADAGTNLDLVPANVIDDGRRRVSGAVGSPV